MAHNRISGNFVEVPVIVGYTAQEVRLLTAIYETGAGRPITQTQMEGILLAMTSLEILGQIYQRYPANIYGTPSTQATLIVTDSEFAAGLTWVPNAIT